MEKKRLYIEENTHKENNKKDDYTGKGIILKRYYTRKRLYGKEII